MKMQSTLMKITIDNRMSKYPIDKYINDDFALTTSRDKHLLINTNDLKHKTETAQLSLNLVGAVKELP